MKTKLPCYILSRRIVDHHEPVDNLRLEVSPSRFHIFSYHHLNTAVFESTKERDTLTISFLQHQVRIAGRNLRDLAYAIQERTVESVNPIPDRYTTATTGQDGIVESIEIETNGTTND